MQVPPEVRWGGQVGEENKWNIDAGATWGEVPPGVAVAELTETLDRVFSGSLQAVDATLVRIQLYL